MELDQKKYVLQANTNDLGLPRGEMWPFMSSNEEEDEKDAYEDLAAAEDDLEYFRQAMEKKKMKLKEQTSDQYL